MLSAFDIFTIELKLGFLTLPFAIALIVVSGIPVSLETLYIETFFLLKIIFKSITICSITFLSIPQHVVVKYQLKGVSIINIDGLDELQNEVKKLENNLKSISGTNTVSFEELFSNQFIQLHTTSSSISEFLKRINITDQESFESCPQDKLENLVKTETHFDSWSDMQEKALTDYVNRKLEL